MDDTIEIAVTINSDTFPLLWEFLNEIRAGRRRAAALMEMARRGAERDGDGTARIRAFFPGSSPEGTNSAM